MVSIGGANGTITNVNPFLGTANWNANGVTTLVTFEIDDFGKATLYWPGIPPEAFLVLYPGGIAAAFGQTGTWK